MKLIHEVCKCCRHYEGVHCRHYEHEYLNPDAEDLGESFEGRDDVITIWWCIGINTGHKYSDGIEQMSIEDDVLDNCGMRLEYMMVDQLNE